MNLIDEFLASLPFSEVVIRTTLNSYAVLERIEHSLKPGFVKWQKSQFFTFEGSLEGNYFKLQGHLRNPNGEDAFPNYGLLRYAFIQIRFRMETSPTFYGRVFGDGEGATIRGHFGIPFPSMALLIVFFLMLLAKLFPAWENHSLGPVLFLILWSVFSLLEFITERKGIIDFLNGLFYDVIKRE